MSEYPDWFQGFITEAEQFALKGQDHGLLETALAIARECKKGNTDDARQIYESARPQLIRLRMGEHGEIGSTQVRSMLRSRLYPKEIRRRIAGILR